MSTTLKYIKVYKKNRGLLSFLNNSPRLVLYDLTISTINRSFLHFDQTLHSGRFLFDVQQNYSCYDKYNSENLENITRFLKENDSYKRAYNQLRG